MLLCTGKEVVPQTNCLKPLLMHKSIFSSILSQSIVYHIMIVNKMNNFAHQTIVLATVKIVLSETDCQVNFQGWIIVTRTSILKN